jgi:hypothetical protein
LYGSQVSGFGSYSWSYKCSGLGFVSNICGDLIVVVMHFQLAMFEMEIIMNLHPVDYPTFEKGDARI